MYGMDWTWHANLAVRVAIPSCVVRWWWNCFRMLVMKLSLCFRMLVICWLRRSGRAIRDAARSTSQGCSFPGLAWKKLRLQFHAACSGGAGLCWVASGTGRARDGAEQDGTERFGTERAGMEWKQDITEQERGGCERDRAGWDGIGTGWDRDGAGQDGTARYGTGVMGRHKTGWEGMGWDGMGRMGQDWAGQDGARRGRSGWGRMGWDRTRRDRM